MALPTNSEQQIVHGILSGHEPSLRRFYERYAPFVTNFVRLRVANEHDVEEIVQDTLLASLEALRDFTFRSSLSTFIISIAKRKVIDLYRKKSLKRLVPVEHSHIESVLSVLSNPEEKLDNVFLQEAIEIAFTKIKPKYRTVITMKYVEGRSIAEIAQELTMSLKSVESMLFRARKAFVEAYAY